jgi:hypothetical protein
MESAGGLKREKKIQQSAASKNRSTGKKKYQQQKPYKKKKTREEQFFPLATFIAVYVEVRGDSVPDVGLAWGVFFRFEPQSREEGVTPLISLEACLVFLKKEFKKEKNSGRSIGQL